MHAFFQTEILKRNLDFFLGGSGEFWPGNWLILAVLCAGCRACQIGGSQRRFVVAEIVPWDSD